MSFPETIWTAIDDARLRADAQSRKRLGDFLGQYREPILRFVRARGYSAADAEDLTQEFMIRVWERDLLLQADAQRGRLRSFLLVLLSRFLSDRGMNRRRRQDAFESRMQSADAVDAESMGSTPEKVSIDAEQAFMRHWARSAVRLVHDRTRAIFTRSGKAEWYDIFLQTFSSEETTQESLAEQFGKSRDQIRYAIERVKEEFLNQLREAVAEQLRDPALIEEEMREVLRLSALAGDDPD